MIYNKKISTFDVIDLLTDGTVIPVVQDSTNYKISYATLKTNLSDSFASNVRMDDILTNIEDLDNKIDSNYIDLSNKITVGDNSIRSGLTNTIVSYYDQLSNTIISLTRTHEQDLSNLENALQDWADEVSGKVNTSDLQNLINRLTITENLLTQLSEIVYDYSGNPGSGGGGTPGYHTQSTSTIFPLSGYYLTGSIGALSTTDSLNQALAKLEGRIRVVESTGGGGGGGNYYLIKLNDQTQATDGNVYSAVRSDANYLSKKNNDTAAGKITFLQGLQAGPVFSEGFLGTGAALFRNGNKWKFEVDELFVRGGLTVNELIVNEIKAVGGEILVSVADMEIVSVDIADAQSVYRCYFDDQDGTVANQFQVYDQAICQKFDGQNVKRYWRLVTAVGSNYVELSMTDFEPGSGLPEVGDKLLQLGNRNDAARRSAIMISAKGSDGPTIKMYDNIYEYSLENKERTVLGKNSRFIGTIQVTDYTGDAYPVPVDKGAYVPGNTYYYYDRVSYDGSLWLCMAINTTETPSLNNPDVWLQQVSRGQTGTSGSDVGKWTRIMGDGIFFYDNSTFSGIPTPSALTLTCETFNLANPIFKWINTVDNAVLGTGNTLTLAHTVLGINRQILIRCEVTDGDDVFMDEAQVGKVANGNDSYLVRLDNQTMTAPYDAKGENPMMDLINIYSNIEVYRGINRLEINNVTANLLSGTATVTLARQNPTRWRATWGTLTTNSARILLTITTSSGTFTGELVMYKNFAGEPGTPGVDAGAVVVTGPNMFVVDPVGNTTTPAEITLTVSSYSVAQPSIKWYWSYVDEYIWQEITGQVSNTLIVGPNMYGFNSSASNEVIFKASVTSGTTDITYEDWMTIAKVRNGIDGEGSYIASLSNENHSVPANYLGEVDNAELTKAKTTYMLMMGTTEMSSSEYTVTVVNLDSTDTSTVDLDTIGKTVTLKTFDSTKDSTIWKIEFRVGGNVVAVKDFTISKTKGGAPADYDVHVYAFKTGTAPSRPDFIEAPTASGSTGAYPDYVSWYPQVPSGSPIYMSKARFSGKTQTAMHTGSFRWSAPVRLTGVNGLDGQQGPAGPQGPAGSKGDAGLQGPGLNFRGAYQTNTQYYISSRVVDVVKYNADGRYYMRKNITYPSTTTSPTNTTYWEALNSFTNIATGLLFAEEATIAGMVFNPNIIRSINNNFIIDGRNTVSWDTDRIFPLLIGQNVVSVSSTYPFNSTISPSNASFQFAICNSTGRWAGQAWSGATIGQGIFQVGTSQSGNICGLSSLGTSPSSVRFWAGSSSYKANMESSPFRVTADGSLYASKATISGTITSNDSGNRIVIDPIDRSLKMISSSNVTSGLLMFSETRATLVLGEPPSINTQITAGSLYVATGAGYFSVHAGTVNNQYNMIVQVPGLPRSSTGLLISSLWLDSEGYLRVYPF